MGRYFFNARNAFGFAKDEEGRELANVDEARDVAIDAARSLMSADVRSGTLDLGGQIEIAGPQGTTIAVVTFSEAVTIKSVASAEGAA